MSVLPDLVIIILHFKATNSIAKIFENVIAADNSMANYTRRSRSSTKNMH